jgi:hypothetical protein
MRQRDKEDGSNINFGEFISHMPVPMAAPSEAKEDLDLFNTEIVGSNPA